MLCYLPSTVFFYSQSLFRSIFFFFFYNILASLPICLLILFLFIPLKILDLFIPSFYFIHFLSFYVSFSVIFTFDYCFSCSFLSFFFLLTVFLFFILLLIFYIFLFQTLILSYFLFSIFPFCLSFIFLNSLLSILLLISSNFHRLCLLSTFYSISFFFFPHNFNIFSCLFPCSFHVLFPLFFYLYFNFRSHHSISMIEVVEAFSTLPIFFPFIDSLISHLNSLSPRPFRIEMKR